MNNGKIHIYTGDGKGKTTAAMGLALRAAGSGKKVLIYQFLKDGKSSELKTIDSLENVEVVFQDRTFGFTWTLTEEELRQAAAYYAGILEEAFRRAADFDLLVLDEAMCALAAGLIREERLKELLLARHDGLEVVMTGRGMPETMAEAADYITELRKIKHPYDQGVPQRLGIEY